MKSRAIVIAAALFAGLASPSFAFDGLHGTSVQSLVAKVSCNVLEDDKQALCARKCDDEFISGKMHYGADLAKVAADKKACDEKCGCAENTK